MRKPKTAKTEIIRLIQTTWRETKRGKSVGTDEQREVLAAIKDTLDFLGVVDELRGDCHKKVFINRHLSLNDKLTQRQIANRYHMCVDSVGDYCSMHLKVFEEYLKKAKKSRDSLTMQNREK